MIILWNNEFVEREQCAIELEDRGYQFGDGIYEVIPVYHRKIFWFNEHLDRLKYSANQIKLALPFYIEQLKEMLNKLVEINQLENGQIYIQITRGSASRNHLIPKEIYPVLTAYVMNKPQPTDQQKNGAYVITLEDIRWLRCDIKSLNLLGNLLLKQQAFENGAFETILHRNGTVTEGSVSNTFIVKDKTIKTHPANNLILNGITRQTILKIAQDSEIPYVEEPYSIDELYKADEVFHTGTTIEVLPIVKVDNIIIGDGIPGELSKTLLNLFHQKILDLNS